MTEPREILAILHQDRVQFKAMLKTLPETEIDAAFEEADREEKLEFLRLLPIKQAASTFSDLPLSEQVDFLPDLPSDRLRLMGAFLGPDEVADLIGEVSDADDRQYLLSSLPPVLVRSPNCTSRVW